MLIQLTGTKKFHNTCHFPLSGFDFPPNTLNFSFVRLDSQISGEKYEQQKERTRRNMKDWYYKDVQKSRKAGIERYHKYRKTKIDRKKDAEVHLHYYYETHHFYPISGPKSLFKYVPKIKSFFNARKRKERLG